MFYFVVNGNDVNYVIDNLTNRYNSIDSNAPQYDNAGNLTKDWREYEYEYDYENRIVEINDVNGNRIAEFAYDALGRRIRKIDSVTSANTMRYDFGKKEFQTWADIISMQKPQSKIAGALALHF